MASSKSTPLPSLWASIKSSFYDPDFYKKAPTFPFGKVMGYLLLVSTLSYLIFLGKGAFLLYENRDEIQQGIDKILDSYPENLELTFTDGHLSSNVQEPFFFPEGGIEEAFKNEEDVTVDSDAPKYFVVIDTQTPFSVEQLKSYDSIVWLSGDSAYVSGNNGELRAYPYSEDLNQVVTRQTVQETITQVLAQIKTPLIIGGVVLLVLGEFGLFLYFFAYLAFAALLYFIFSQSAGKKHEYLDCYRIAVYAITPAWALSMLIQIINIGLPLQMPPFMFTAIVLLTVYFNVHHKEKTHS